MLHPCLSEETGNLAPDRQCLTRRHPTLGGSEVGREVGGKTAMHYSSAFWAIHAVYDRVLPAGCV